MSQATTDATFAAAAPHAAPPAELQPFTPPGLVAGCLPLIADSVEQMVWNAAAEACDSEQVCHVHSAHGDRVWYIAVRSAELASTPGTWAPFAAVLPGMPGAPDGPGCYVLREGEGETATLLVVGHGSLRLHRGASSIIHSKATREAQELGGAPVVDMDDLDLAPVPWVSQGLTADRARRTLALLTVLTGAGAAALAMAAWLVGTTALLANNTDVSEIQSRTRLSSAQLVQAARDFSVSPLRQQMADLLLANDTILRVGGWIKRYDIDNGVVSWTGFVPPSTTPDVIQSLSARTIGAGRDGYVTIQRGDPKK